jgi:hypothetical protein
MFPVIIAIIAGDGAFMGITMSDKNTHASPSV